MNEARAREQGFTLVEALVAVALIASAGVVASTAALAMLRLERAAHAEAAGLAAASEKLEELIATRPADRRSGNDTTVLDGVAVTRVWRVLDDQPARDLVRLEVTSRWDHPQLTLLTLVAAAPGRSAP
ncbi:MAG TPA: prepilin-type N-terminal cleavage/methylation domain-containing protein [Candidatus Binatia bacterium]